MINQQKSEEFFFRRRAHLALFFGLTAILAGSWQMWRQMAAAPVEITIPTPSPQEIIVDIGGAVIRPGSYRFNRPARVKDLLIISGGLQANADRRWVDRYLNLSQYLRDGSKIYIPRQGETVSGEKEEISLNQATVGELIKLPGIGPQLAAAIIRYRQRHHGFKTVAELQAVPGIGGKMFLKINHRLRL